MTASCRRCLLFAVGLALLVAPKLATAQIDGSGTITTGGTAQTVFTGRTRTYLFCQNPIGASETLFINAPTAAGATNGSYELAAGATLTFNGTFTPQGDVSVYAATTGHRFICKQG